MTLHDHPCYHEARKAAGRDLSGEELDELFGRIEKEAGRYMKQGLSPKEALEKAGFKLADEERLAGIIEANSRKINLLRKAELEKRIIAGDEAASLEGLLAGKENGEYGAALSVSANMHGAINRIMGPLTRDLEEAGVFKPLMARDEEFDADVAREMWRLDAPEQFPETGNVLAAKAARILSEHQDIVRLMQNKQGAWIGKAEHYVTRQSHDMWKIRGGGKEEDYHEWRDVIAPLLDEKTFDSMGARQTQETFLRETWLSLASGEHDGVTGKEWLAGFKGPGNMAKRVSRNRVLIFRDADGWLQYNKKYGTGHVVDSIFKSMISGARNAAIMRDLGTNPVRMFQDLADKAMAESRNRGDATMVDKIRKIRDGALLDSISGRAQQPANKTPVVIGQYALALNQVTKLGGVAVSSLPDLAINASVLRHNGVPFLESYWNGLKSLAPGLGSKNARERKAVARMLGVGIQGHLGSVMNRFAAVDAPLGRMSSLVNTFYKWNGLQYETESLSEGIGMMLSHNMGRDAGKSFEKLHPKLQRSLKRFGITAPEWQAIRQAVYKTSDGTEYILPSEIAKLPDEAVAHLVPEGQEADDVREMLSNRIYTYISDQTREGMTEVDARTAAVFRGAYNKLDEVSPWLGQAARLMLQFKSFPVSHLRRAWAREVQRFGPDWPGIVHMIAGTTLLGYAAMQCKAILAGREPHDASDWRTWQAAMIQGGGAGIYGDFLFGQQSRVGNSFLENLAGPTISDMSRLAHIFTATRDGVTGSADAEKAGTYLSEMVRFATGEIPGNNLPFVNMLLKYGVVYRLQDMINPGYSRRYEKQVERNTGQGFLISPTWNPYGGN